MRVVFSFPQNLYPPSSGYHLRGLEILSGLKHFGCNTCFLSTGFYGRHPWSNYSIQYLEGNLVDEVRIYQPNPWDRLIWLLSKYHRVIDKYSPVLSNFLTPPGYRKWFRRLVGEFSPDMIWLNYIYFDGLLDHAEFEDIIRAIDIIDLFSLNRKMWRAVSSLQKPSACISAENVDESVLDEEFFTKNNFQPDSWEYKIYDQYSFTVSINSLETEVIKNNVQHTQVVHIPMIMQLPTTITDYSGAPIFPTGDNPYNVQGYFYFVKKVLPLILKEADNFCLQVTGYCSARRVSQAEGILLSGYLPDLASTYQTARFLVCPIFGGTGQLVKVIEAMSYGLPAIILSQAAMRAPVRQNDNGFIANNAQEFAEYTLRLWNDRELCRRMGKSARDTIATEYSPSQLYDALKQVINR